MLQLICVGIGGALGSVLRYLVGGLGYAFFTSSFPVGTLVVNLLGSFVIGFLWGLFERVPIAPLVRMFVFIGILGGFTTFSTFTIETFNLIRAGAWKIALTNVVLSNVLGIMCVLVGFVAARWICLVVK